MTARVQLLYFDGCPNVELARENVRKAFGLSRLEPEWREVDLRSPDCPASLRGFPSPSVLVDGREVGTGRTEAGSPASCRLGGLPSADQIARALRRRSWSAAAASAPAALIGSLPASFCPACYPALAGLLGALGLGAYGELLLAPLTAALLLVALGGLLFQAKRTGDYRAFSAGAVGAAGVYAGQFLLVSTPLKLAGVAILVGASLWNVVPKITGRSERACPACREGR